MLDNSRANVRIGVTTLDGAWPSVARVRPAASVRRAWLLALLLIFFESAQAGDGILIEHVPSGANRSQVLAVVQQAFIGRKWTIEKVDDVSVTATISNAPNTARMRVFISGDTLLYEESGTVLKAVSRGSSSVQRKVEASTPERWIAYLRSDIAMALAVIPDDATSKKAADDPNSVAERLKVLEELRKADLISQDEYEKKRAAILSSL